MSRWALAAELEALRRQGLHRRPRSREPGAGPRIFCSNDYLGLAQDPRLSEAAAQALARYGVGSGAAHLVTGQREVHEALEAALAAFLGRERALLFSTGYMANLGVVQALLGRHDAVFEDKLNHASLVDATALAGARRVRYRHADPEHLAQRLVRTEAQRKLIVTDGVFSMDGDMAPLAELAELAATHDAWLMVDDAHGLGVLAEGRGSAAACGLSAAQVPVLVGTLGKAFGTFGAFVAGSAELIDYLVQRARTYVYTTAAPPAVAAATLRSLELVMAEPWRRERLRELIARFRAGVAQLGLPLLESSTPIQPLLVGPAQAALELSAALERAGFLVSAIRPPTVPAGSARLRVTLSAAHAPEDVDGLLGALAELVPRWPR